MKVTKDNTQLWYVEWIGGNYGTYERDGDDFYHRFKQGDRCFSGHASNARLIRKVNKIDKGE